MSRIPLPTFADLERSAASDYRGFDGDAPKQCDEILQAWIRRAVEAEMTKAKANELLDAVLARFLQRDPEVFGTAIVLAIEGLKSLTGRE